MNARYVPVYPATPVFYAHCAQCGRSHSSNYLLADTAQPWTYVCRECIALAQELNKSSGEPA